jgi:hypothetical protein
MVSKVKYIFNLELNLEIFYIFILNPQIWLAPIYSRNLHQNWEFSTEKYHLKILTS